MSGPRRPSAALLALLPALLLSACDAPDTASEPDRTAAETARDGAPGSDPADTDLHPLHDEAGATALATQRRAWRDALAALLEAPDADSLAAARNAWADLYSAFNDHYLSLAAVACQRGVPERLERLDGWPFYPAYVDALPAWPDSGIVNDPALELTAQSCDTLGPGPAMLIDHYKSILRDKVEGDAANADADSLALELVDNYPDAKKFIDATCSRWGGRLGLEAVDSSWGLYNRYKNAFSFLAGYDSDERAKVLRWFKNKWPNQVADGSVTPSIFIDDSGRSIMRFLAWPAGSALAELSRKYAVKTKENKKHAWTSGKHAVLFELRSYVTERPQSRDTDEAEYGWNLFLVIGPLEGIDRHAWITRLRKTLNGHFSTRAGAGIPTVRHAAITATFFSLLKWELKGRNVATLAEELTSPALLTCIDDVARTIERTLLEEDDGTNKA